MLLALLPLSLALAACLAQPAPPNASTIAVALPVRVPPTALPLASTLLSFSIEQDRWPDWSGTDARNAFTHAALARLHPV